MMLPIRTAACIALTCLIAFAADSTFTADSASAAGSAKTVKKRIGKQMITKCPEDMEYIIMDYNPKVVYEVCIDRYEYPNQVGQMPMTGMTWYKAKELCDGKGKYLCWDKEWTKACVGLNNWDFGYYNVYDSAKCNVKSDGIKKIGDNPDCKTKNYDVYDMVGNAREWTRGGGIGASGGSYKDGRAARCSKWDALTLKRGFDDVGFRCCERVFTGRYGKVSKEVLLQGKNAPATPEPELGPDSAAAPKDTAAAHRP